MLTTMDIRCDRTRVQKQCDAYLILKNYLLLCYLISAE